MKPVHAIYTPATREAVEKYNASLAALAAERAAIQAERERVMADAIGGTGTAASLRKRIDASRDKELQADISELQALGEIPALDKMVRQDWREESARLRILEADRRGILEKTADELGAAGVQRHHMIVTDAVRLGYDRGAADATSKSSAGILHEDDPKRIETLKAQISAALLR